jgi:hypothetical protein
LEEAGAVAVLDFEVDGFGAAEVVGAGAGEVVGAGVPFEEASASFTSLRIFA